MNKTILITGATDGIGLETAISLANQGHQVLLHGRSESKMAATLKAIPANSDAKGYLADLSSLSEVNELAEAVLEDYQHIDVVINNAGVLKLSNPITSSGVDARFMVNTIAPYCLTQRLLPAMTPTSRVLNLSSAAQAPVDINALQGKVKMSDMAAYSQSKLAIIMWSQDLAKQTNAPIVIAINPGSLLGTKMVKEGFNTAGRDISIGSDILCRLALDDEFSSASGKYFDNDAGSFAPPHADALNATKTSAVLQAMRKLIDDIT